MWSLGFGGGKKEAWWLSPTGSYGCNARLVASYAPVGTLHSKTEVPCPAAAPVVIPGRLEWLAVHHKFAEALNALNTCIQRLGLE